MQISMCLLSLPTLYMPISDDFNGCLKNAFMIANFCTIMLTEWPSDTVFASKPILDRYIMQLSGLFTLTTKSINCTCLYCLQCSTLTTIGPEMCSRLISQILDSELAVVVSKKPFRHSVWQMLLYVLRLSDRSFQNSHEVFVRKSGNAVRGAKILTIINHMDQAVNIINHKVLTIQFWAVSDQKNTNSSTYSL